MYTNCNSSVRFQVLTAASMKFKVFWDVAPYSLIGVDRRFITLMMEAVCTSETLVNSSGIIRGYIPKDSKL
jgi:hypothetical protein